MDETISNTARLEFDGVTLSCSGDYDTGVWDVRLRLMPGELALVRAEAGHPRVPLADLAQGLVDPDEGRVLSLGECWRQLGPAGAGKLRGRIGRVFDGVGWVAELSVYDNVLLGQRYHTRRPLSELADEAAQLARMFGLPGLPRGRPEQLRRQDLQRANCVRCFLGNPELIVLEHPTTGVYADIMQPLANAVRAARRRGAAVLWVTTVTEIWNDPGLRATYTPMMSGAQFLLNNNKEPS